jgi:hypothetical protein
MQVNKKKIATVVATGAVGLAGAGVAFGYWSTSGSGTGSASTSAGAANLSISQTSTISNMYPGDSAQTISGSVTNQAANAAYVTSVTVSIAGVTQAPAATGSCDASDYTLATPTMTVGQDVAAGGTATFSGATLKFNNKASNQDGCKGATVNLSYAAI